MTGRRGLWLKDRIRFTGRIHRKLYDKKGETLLEVVLSLGLFSVTMLTAASMFLAAMRTARSNYDADRTFDRMMTSIVRDEGTVTEAERTLVFHFEGTGRSASQGVRLMRTDLDGAGKIYRFRAD